MINMLIVDDEIIVRRGIKTAIEWSSYGICIVGEAKNGKEALEKALELQPHIVVTDVRMPIMDGLEFARNLKEALPNTKIVILSGYDDFEYAKQAIRINVDEYVLKPFGSEELLNLILKLKNKILQEQHHHENALRTQSLIEENRLLLQSKLILSLLKESYDDYTYIQKKAELVQLDISGPMYQVIIIDIDDQYIIMEDLPAKDSEALKKSVLNIASSVIQKHFQCAFCISEFNYFVGLINTKNNATMHIIDVCQQIKEQIQQNLKITVTLCIGNAYAHIKDIPLSYSEALTALRQKIYQGKNAIIHIKQVNVTDQKTTVSSLITPEKDLLTALQKADYPQIQEIIAKMLENLAGNYATEAQIKNYCARILLLSTNALEVMGINIRRDMGSELNVYAHLKNYETVDDISHWMEHLFFKFIESIDHYKNQKYKQIVHVAIEYISEHYTENITLKTLSEVVYVTPNYLSKVFKEETGQNFIEWLNNFRIEKAKELLKDVRYKTYEIAEKVGYSDYKHFSYNFKRYTGKSPRSYRKDI